MDRPLPYSPRLVMFFLLYYSVVYIHGYVQQSGACCPFLGDAGFGIDCTCGVPLGVFITGGPVPANGNQKHGPPRDVWLSTGVVDGYKDNRNGSLTQGHNLRKSQ